MISAAAVELLDTPNPDAVPALELDHIPRPDYRAHPAYAAAARGISLAERIGAFGRYWPVFRQAYAELGAPSGPRAPRELSEPGAARLADWGILAAHAEPAHLAELRELCAPTLERITTRRAPLAPSERIFRINHEAVDLKTPANRACIERLLGAKRVFDAAKAYVGGPVFLKAAYLQYNEADDEAVTHCFKDVGLRDSRTVSLHIDSTTRWIKCLVYLSPVTHLNGPFRYVKGSHRVVKPRLEYAARLAHDRLFGDGTAPDDRRRFMALPSMFRHKGQFGSDLLDDHASVDALVRSEIVCTSDIGDVFLFDTTGFHRGAILVEGSRLMLQVVLAYE